MAEVRIRTAVAADVPLLAPIEKAGDQQFTTAGHPEVGDGPPIPDDVAIAGVNEGRIAVAELDGALVGWVYIHRVGAELSVGQVSVHPDQQRRGVGTALMRHVMDLADQRGEPSIVLNTQADVPWNQPWYARLGFEVVPTSEWTDGMAKIAADQTASGLDWTTRVHMRRRPPA